MSRIASVTGVSGFVGSAVAAELLRRGYVVRGIVRFAPTSERAAQLRTSLLDASGGAGGSLELVAADLLAADQGPLQEAVRGSQYVFHVASPFAITVANPQQDLIRPAVEGTRNVLHAAAASKDTVQRVVVTSSVCAIHDCHAKQARSRGGPDARYCEDDWNEVSTLEEEPYWLSKVLGEREAWRLSQELGVPVTTVLPNFVMGPVSASAAAGSLSVGFLKGAITGDAPLSGSWVFADVRDVAAAHVLAAETPAAAGQRYIVSAGRSLSGRQVTDALKAALPQLPVVDGEPEEERRNIDATKVERELGLQYHEPEQSIADMAASLLALGLVGGAAAS